MVATKKSNRFEYAAIFVTHLQEAQPCSLTLLEQYICNVDPMIHIWSYEVNLVEFNFRSSDLSSNDEVLYIYHYQALIKKF